MSKDRARRRGGAAPAAASRAASASASARPAAFALPGGPVVPLALVLLSSVALHWRALAAPFFADDWLFLDMVRSRSLVGALVAHDPIGNYFRPLGRAVWFWLLAHASGESSVVFHAANLALFLSCVVMLWLLARRVAGERAALAAAAVLALSYAADVPLRWASGSQELVAVTLALGAMLAFVSGRRAAAAVLFLLAPLAKEIVAFAVIPAALLARKPREPWRTTALRAWPALAATAVWAAIAVSAAARHQGASPLSFSPDSPLAALTGPLRVLFGLEWSTGVRGDALGLAAQAPDALTPFALVGVALAALAVGLGWGARPRAASGARAEAADAARLPAPAPAPGRALLGAAAWMVVGALPVALVAPIWSAYFYLFALCGAALLVGALLASRPAAVSATAVLVLGLLSRRAGELHEFATQPAAFSPASHVNDFYLDRGMKVVSRAVADFRQLHPKLEPRSTFFFTGLPSFAGIQAADGPLLRAVYRDSSLRSYYLTDLNRARMQRGPAWFVFYDPTSGHFEDQTDDPELFLRVALGQILNGHEDAAREALEVGRSRGRVSPTSHYLAAFMALEAGDRAGASARFVQAQCREAADGDEVVRAAHAMVAAGDTLGAVEMLSVQVPRHVLNPALHATLAELELSVASRRRNAAFEAYVARVLAPQDGMAWRRWAYALYWQSRFPQAQAALERYFEMSPTIANNDPGAMAMRGLLPRMMPGGDLMQRALMNEASR